MAEPLSLNVKLDINRAMETLGTWVASLAADQRLRTDKAAKKATSKLVKRLSMQSGLNDDFAEMVSDPDFGRHWRYRQRLKIKLNALQKGMQKIEKSLNKIDPEFSSAHPQLIASLTFALGAKDSLLWRAKLYFMEELPCRESFEEAMRAQAITMKELAKKLSKALEKP